MIIAIDFDGTLHTGEWPSIGEPMPYAADTLRRLRDDGHYLIIWSCREGAPQTAMVNWLLENRIPFDRLNDHHPEIAKKYGYAARKVFADLYLDDKQLGGLPDWETILGMVRAMR